MLKRLFDIVIAGVGIVIFGPFLLLIGLAVWISSGTPIFFRQNRLARNGQFFFLLKFRTMSVKAGAEKGSFDAGSAQRVTPVGRFLRKTKLDELPQLWNVLQGDMSLVGPRPEVQKWVDTYPRRGPPC